MCSAAKSCLTPCDPMDCSPPGSSVPGISQATALEWVATSFSRGSSWPRDWTCSSYASCIGRQILYHWATWKPDSAEKDTKAQNNLKSLHAALFPFRLPIYSFNQDVVTLPGEGNGNPLQYSCLEDPVDREAWWATVHGVTNSRTRLSNSVLTH